MYWDTLPAACAAAELASEDPLSSSSDKKLTSPIPPFPPDASVEIYILSLSDVEAVAVLGMAPDGILPATAAPIF